MGILNERIKERRLAVGLTLLQVAEFLGVKEATAQRYESGEIKNIKHETIYKLSEIFRCSPSYLMGWIDTPQQQEDRFEHLTDEEKRLVAAYRKKPEMRASVNKLLDVEAAEEAGGGIADDISETVRNINNMFSNKKI